MLNYNSNTIYRDLMKKVHPDVNKEANATVRAQLVNQNKTNVYELRRLAIMWGYMVNPTMTRPETRRPEPQPRETFRPREEWVWEDLYNEAVAPNILFDLFLRPNTVYNAINGVEYQLYFTLRKMRHVARIIRTTKKCVVVDFGGREKIVKMSQIFRVAKRIRK